MRIPVRADGVIVERVDHSRALHLAKASNAEVIRKRKTKEIVGINLKSAGDDSGLDRRHNNPRSHSHKNETETNPPNCWTLKRIHSKTADIYGAVVNDLAA